jgi:glycosyltransferase involved in cell wall biosynthesis
MRAWNLAERRFGFPYPFPGPVSAARLAALARRADVLHVHDCLYVASAVAIAAARSAGRPVLLTQHVAEVPYPSALLRGLQAGAYGTLGRAILAGADQVVFVGERVRRSFAGWRFRRPPRVIENGIDTALFRPAGAGERRTLKRRLGLEGAPLLLFVGRFVQKKGVGLLRSVAAAEPGWNWLFVGRAGDHDPATWNLANVRVRAPVPQAELRDLYAAADLLVLPSRGEGFPVAVQEAMACGTPALVSGETAGGLEGGGDLLLQSEPEACAVLARLRESLPALGARLRTRVAAFASERWSVERAAHEYERLLASLLPA